MANKDQLEILEKGVDAWNQWRLKNPLIKPDLSEANLREADLYKADLSGANLIDSNLIDANLSEANLIDANLSDANLSGANLSEANLRKANLIGANLIGTNLEKAILIDANLSEANLWEADLKEAKLNGANLRDANLQLAKLSKADLRKAHLSEADLSFADLSHANLSGAGLRRTKIIRANLNGATLTDCRVFGVSAWGVKGLDRAEQSSLVITPKGEPVITVDNLEVAQFIYLMLHSEKIRYVINTITSKVVLILGRFTPERKAILDAIREELRKQDYLPILFDFEKPANRDLTETVLTLAGLARFVIADLTDAKNVPQELTVIVHNLPSVPVQPIILSPTKEYGMFEHFKRYPWVLKAHLYTDKNDLLKSFGNKVIDPAEKKARKLQKDNHSIPSKKRAKKSSKQRSQNKAQ